MGPVYRAGPTLLPLLCSAFIVLSAHVHRFFLTIAQPNPDGSLPVPAAPDAAANAAAGHCSARRNSEALQAQVAQLQEILAKPLTGSWPSTTRPRGRRRVGFFRGDVDAVAARRAAWRWIWRPAGRERARGGGPAPGCQPGAQCRDEDLGGTVAPAQLAHIARHKAFCASSFSRAELQGAPGLQRPSR